MQDFSQEHYVSELHLFISAISLNVKFLCRMHLRHQNQKITDDVVPNSSLIFTFNKEIILKDIGPKGSIEITIHLTTEKGNNILAGSVKIQTAELSILQGQNLTVPLSNCLDSTAKCHLKIFRVKNVKMRKDNNRFRAASGISSIRGEVNQKHYLGHLSNVMFQEKQKNWKQSQRYLQEQPNREIYDIGRESRLKSIEKQASQRKKSDNSRQKYKHQFDAIQSNLKMDIVRLKLKVEELERSNEEKFRQIKNLNEELNNIKIAEYNNLYLNEEMQNKTKLLGTYDNYLKDLRKENEQLRNKKLQLEKKIITTQENKQYDIEKLQASFEQERANFQKQFELLKEQIKILEFQDENKKGKIEKLKLMIEDYEKRIEENEDEYKMILKNQKEESKKKCEVLKNQIKCIQSALKVEQMAKKQLQAENMTLKQKLRDKETQILLFIQEVNILKTQIINKDDFKLKFAEINRAKSLAERNLAESEAKIKKYKQNQTQYEEERKKTQNQYNKLKFQLKSERQKTNQLTKKIQQYKNKLVVLEIGGKKEEKVFKTFEWEIKYIQDNEKDWRQIMKSKNQRILQLTEMIEKKNRELNEIQKKKDKQIKILKAQKQKMKEVIQDLTRKLKDQKFQVEKMEKIIKQVNDLKEKEKEMHKKFESDTNNLKNKIVLEFAQKDRIIGVLQQTIKNTQNINQSAAITSSLPLVKRNNLQSKEIHSKMQQSNSQHLKQLFRQNSQLKNQIQLLYKQKHQLQQELELTRINVLVSENILDNQIPPPFGNHKIVQIVNKTLPTQSQPKKTTKLYSASSNISPVIPKQIIIKQKNIKDLLSYFSDLTIIIQNNAEILNGDKNEQKVQSITFTRGLSIQKLLKIFNEEFRSLKQLYDKKCIQCQNYINVICKDIDIKNQYKAFNLELIQKKAEQGLSQANTYKRVFQLQTQNTRLKVRLQQIMKDYSKRIQAITTLKNNLSLLNNSIQQSQQQTEEIKLKSYKFEEKMKAKDYQLKRKQSQIVQLQDRYKQILQFYTKQLQKSNNDKQNERRKHIDQKNVLKDECHKLRHKVNQLTFQNQQLTKSFQFYKEQMEIQRLNASVLNQSIASSNRKYEIEQRLIAIEDERKMMENQIKLRDQKILQLQDLNSKYQTDLMKQKETYQIQIEKIKYDHQIHKIETNKKVVQVQTMINQLNAQTNKIIFGRTQNLPKIKHQEILATSQKNIKSQMSSIFQPASKEVEKVSDVNTKKMNKNKDPIVQIKEAKRLKSIKSQTTQNLPSKNRQIVAIQGTAKIKTEKSLGAGLISKGALSPRTGKPKFEEKNQLHNWKSAQRKK